ACLADQSIFGPRAQWGETGPYLLTDTIARQGLSREAAAFGTAYPWHHSRPFDVFDPNRCDEIVAAARGAAFQHLWHENFRRCGLNKFIRPPPGSYLDLLFQRHDVTFPDRGFHDHAVLERIRRLYERTLRADEEQRTISGLCDSLNRAHAQATE